MKTDFLMPGIKRITLPNGLRIIFVRGPRPKKNVIRIGFKAGSGYENDENAGLFHLVEHLLFKSTKVKKTKQILEELEEGGTEVNAFTDPRSTVFHAKALPYLTGKILRSFFELVANQEYNSREFNLEKSVVLEEMKNDEDDHPMRSEDLLFSSLFPGQYLGRSVSGYFNTLKTITKTDSEEAKKKYYIPNNAAIVIVGKTDNEEELIEIIQDTFGRLEPGIMPPPLPKIDIFNSQTIQMVSRDGLTSQAYLCLGYKVPGSNHKDYPKLALLTSVLSGAMSSRLSIALRGERGIGYEIGADLADFGDIGVFYVSIPGFYKKRIKSVVSAISKEFKDLREKTVSALELERAQNQFLSHYEGTLEESDVWADRIMDKEFFGTPFDFRRFVAHIKKITPEDIQKIAQDYLTDDYTLTALLPKGFTPFK